MDRKLEQLRPVLIADVGEVAEAARGEQCGFAPRRVISAFVPRVVPKRTDTGGIGSPAASPNKYRTPNTGDSCPEDNSYGWPIAGGGSSDAASRKLPVPGSNDSIVVSATLRPVPSSSAT